MSVTVRLPPYWRKLTDRQAELEADGGTVGEVLADVVRQFPSLRERMYGEDGRLAKNLSVFLNRESIGRQDGEKTKVSPGDLLMIVLAISGG